MKFKRLLSRFLVPVLASALMIPLLLPVSTKADSMPDAASEVAAINVGWNLGNTLDSYGTWLTNVTPEAVETCWNNPLTTKAMIESVKNQGFNAIRIPVTWAQFTDSEGNVDESWMARVKEVVDYAYDLDMYVILNVHHDTGEHGSDKVCWLVASTDSYEQGKDRFTGLWTSIANEFKDYDYHLMFEGYNELLDVNNSWNAPTAGDDAYDAVNKYAQLFVDTVRATGGNNAERNLIVNTYVCSADQQVLDHFVLPEDSATNHLICEVHCYTPWFFSTASDMSNVVFDDSVKAELDSLMERLESFSRRVGTPVIIGEFGPEYKCNETDREEYAAYYISKAAEHGIKCFWWDNGDYKDGSEAGGYALLSRTSLTWREGITNALTDNAVSSGSPDTVSDTQETEAPEEAEVTEASEPATQETEITETSSEQQETTQALQESEQTLKNDFEESQSAGNEKSVKVPLIIAAVAVVVVVYVLLFLLGRKKGKSA